MDKCNIQPIWAVVVPTSEYTAYLESLEAASEGGLGQDDNKLVHYTAIWIVVVPTSEYTVYLDGLEVVSEGGPD